MNNEDDDPITINDLPNDMIHVITSFLHLIDIIHIENCCKLFKKICKRNTNELITHSIYGTNLKYIKYINHYNANSTNDFQLKEIKRLKLFIGPLLLNSKYVPIGNVFCNNFFLQLMVPDTCPKNVGISIVICNHL